MIHEASRKLHSHLLSSVLSHFPLTVDMAKRAGLVNWVAGQTGHRSKRVILSGLKNGFGSIGFWVGLTRIFHINFFFLNNMYLPFKKLCNKLLDVKSIILNSPLTSRINSVKLINTYSIILKLYKS